MRAATSILTSTAIAKVDGTQDVRGNQFHQLILDTVVHPTGGHLFLGFLGRQALNPFV